jgi:hypothetical protein
LERWAVTFESLLIGISRPLSARRIRISSKT